MLHPYPKPQQIPVFLAEKAPALQIIVWLVGSVTNYWRMFVVYNLTQRPWPHFGSQNNGMLTPHIISFSVGRHFHTLSDTIGDLLLSRADLDHRLIAWELHYFAFRKGPCCYLAWPPEHQQELLSGLQFSQISFDKTFTPPSYQQVITCQLTSGFRC